MSIIHFVVAVTAVNGIVKVMTCVVQGVREVLIFTGASIIIKSQETEISRSRDKLINKRK